MHAGPTSSGWRRHAPRAPPTPPSPTPPPPTPPPPSPPPPMQHLSARLWYPCDPTPSGPRAWLPAPLRPRFWPPLLWTDSLSSAYAYASYPFTWKKTWSTFFIKHVLTLVVWVLGKCGGAGTWREKCGDRRGRSCTCAVGGRWFWAKSMEC
eukprot:363264-Chlamydomonas_euryale.AAC.4